jgi:hypothetical protein
MNSKARIICLLIGVALLCYTLLRAFNIGFTHDESYTFLYSSHNSFMQIISNRTTLVSANNHILNTLFIKLFYNMFGGAEIALRLQSIFAHAIYLLVTFLLLRNLKSNVLIICGYIILNSNPYLLDFFSLARGYALAISFMMVSIYYFIRFTEDEKEKQLVYSFIAASLAVLSNFALLNYFAALLFIQQVFLFLKYKQLKTNFYKSRNVLIILVVLGIICYEPVRKLIKFNCFDFGGNQGIWLDTAASELNFYLYEQAYTDIVFNIIFLFIKVSVFLYFLFLVYRIFSSKLNSSDKNGLIIFGTLLLIVFSNALQHYLFGAPYIVERFALFITPLYFLSIVYCLDSFLRINKFTAITGFAFSVLLSIGMLVHLIFCMNLNSALNWRYDSTTKEMLSDLEKEKLRTGKKSLKLGITWLNEPVINFYRETKKLDWLEKVDRKGISGEYDYYYIHDTDKDPFPAGKSIIKEYPGSGSRLMK